ncbi:MAG: ion channel [Syntrophobacterales bacterium]
MREQLQRPAVHRRKRFGHVTRWLVRSRTFPVLGAIFLVFLMSSLGVLLFEYPANQGFHNLWDAMWWTLVTAATVGYGDKVPLTTGGRFVAIEKSKKTFCYLWLEK